MPRPFLLATLLSATLLAASGIPRAEGAILGMAFLEIGPATDAAPLADAPAHPAEGEPSRQARLFLGWGAQSAESAPGTAETSDLNRRSLSSYAVLLPQPTGSEGEQRCRFVLNQTQVKWQEPFPNSLLRPPCSLFLEITHDDKFLT